MADLRAYQPSFTAGELSYALTARTDLAKFSSGMQTAINLFIHPHGGASNRAGFEFIGETNEIVSLSRLIPFQFNTEQSYILEFGRSYFRVYRNGAIVLSGGQPYQKFTPYAAVHLHELVFAQEADVMYITHPLYPVQKLSRLADDNWSLVGVLFSPVTQPPVEVIVEPISGSGTVIYSYVVSAVSEATGEESLPSEVVATTNDLTIANARNRVSWSPIAGAGRYIVYRESRGVYGYVGSTSGLFLTDDNVTPDTSDTPQTYRNPFNDVGKFPRCVTFVDQRLAFASSNNEPQACWMSQAGNYENFGVSTPAKPSDAVTFRIRGRQVNEIRSLLTTRGLMILTSGAEWVVNGGTGSDAITPSSIKIDNQGYRGAARVQPLVVGNVILFAQNRGGVIRDFSYDYTQDSFTGRDLTILARHLFDNKNIKAWAYAQAPHSVAWVVLDDGSLLSLTYMREHEVWAWTRHESGPNDNAIFEDVAVVAEGNEDVPYFIVSRLINGVRRRYIERLHTRVFDAVSDAFFVDSGLTYRGAPATRITGLRHLLGETVVALADGNVVRDLKVTDGEGGIGVTLPFAASVVHVGLPVEASLQTLNLDLGTIQGLGTVQGRQKSVSEVTIRVENTRGIFTGPYDDTRDGKHLVEYKQRTTEAWNEAVRLYTGDIKITPPWDWNTNGSMWVKQFDPLPMTILAFMPDVTIGR